MASAAQFRFTTAAGPHTLAPTIAASTPANGATGVARSATKIVLTFNEPVDKATAQGAFDVTSPAAARGGSFGWDTDGVQMTYTVPGTLPYETQVTWTMGTGLKCLGGKNLTAPVTRSFTVTRLGTTRLYLDGALSGYLISTQAAPYFNTRLYAGDGQLNEYYRSFLAFSLAPLSTATLVTSATLSVYQDWTYASDPYAALGGTLLAESVDYGTSLTQSDLETPVLTYPLYRCIGLPPNRSCSWYTVTDRVTLSASPAVNRYGVDVTSKVERDRAARSTRGNRCQFRVRFPTNTNSDLAYNYARMNSGTGAAPPYLDVTYEYP
jgi:hypothetical protein